MSGMKYIYQVMILTGGALFMSNSSCQKDSLNVMKSADFNRSFDLELNGKVVLPKEDSNLMLSFIQLNDSRCPADVQCIWAGNAAVNLRFEAKPGVEALTTLCIGQCGQQFKISDTSRVSLNNINYTVILQEVKPYPGKDRSASPKAVLMVKRN